MSPIATRFEPYGSGELAPAGALADASLAALLKRYKRNVAKRYRICLPDKIDRDLPDGTLWISTKIDGQLWFLVKRAGEVALCAYNGRVLRGVPVADEAARLLRDAPEVVIAGELFAVPQQMQERPRVHHVNRALAEPELAKTLGFRAFDLVEEDGQDAQLAPYEQRWARVTALLQGGTRVGPVETVTGERAVAGDYYEEWVRSSRFEGMVVRSEAGVTFKVKPTLSLDAVIIAFGEGRTGGVEGVRELTVALLRDDGARLHVLGNVGSGLDDEDRLAWHRRLVAMQVESSFRMANREGTLCRFVRPEIVVEVKCSDLMDTDSADLPVRRMVLSYDPATGYEPTAAMPIPAMIHPVLVGERADKLVDVGSIGLDQVYRYMPFEARDAEPQHLDLHASEVLVRRVFTKATKGRTAVRKLLAIATHKAEQDPLYPPFVAFFTDYSPDRKEALKTALRVASTREHLDRHLATWLEENVKRGWEEVAG